MRRKIIIAAGESNLVVDIRRMLDKIPVEVCDMASSANRALEMVEAQKPDLVLVDICLKGALTGIDLAHILNRKDIPFVLLTSTWSQQLFEELKLSCPYGVLIKPFKDTDLLPTIEIALYRWEQSRRLKGSDSVRQSVSQIHSGVIIGRSKELMHVFNLVRQVASHDTTVLLEGESGTGKEGLATRIHELSSRKDAVLVKVNCAALPTQLIESELFGHEKGSFTGAYGRKIGKFEKADGGTIFLDEIGELSMDAQVKILRVLQEMEIERIGGEGLLKVDVRVIAATNRDLEKRVREGNFRLDLYYRLNVFPIKVPPLRQRIEDIPLLVSHFLELFSVKMGKKVNSISNSALQKLINYTWPGNVRDLQNLIERSVLLESGKEVQSIELPRPMAVQQDNVPDDSATVQTILELERDYIRSILAKCRHRVSGSGGAAEILNLPSSTLYSKMKKLGISREY